MYGLPLIALPAYYPVLLLVRYVIIPCLAYDPMLFAIGVCGIVAVALTVKWSSGMKVVLIAALLQSSFVSGEEWRDRRPIQERVRESPAYR